MLPVRFLDLDASRLWDLIEDRSKNALVARLEALGEGARALEAVVIDPYAGYKAAVPASDRFHMQRLAARALTAVRCRRQTGPAAHRGRRGDPMWAVRRGLLRSRQHLTAAQERL